MTKRLGIRLVSLLGCLGGVLVASAVGAEDVMVVANLNVRTVTIYNQLASGNTVPLGTIAGDDTGLRSPAGPALDATRNELFVAGGTVFGSDAPAILVFQLPAVGNVLPVRTISGPATGLTGSEGVALDLTHDELFVVNFSPSTVLVFSRTANGNVAPLRILGGPATGLNGPESLTLDLTNDELFVGNFESNTVTVYSRTASGNTPPLRTLLSSPWVGAVTVDPTHNELFVANYATVGGGVSVYSRTASGAAAPLRTLSGPATGLNGPRGLALNLARDELFVTNFGNVGDQRTSTVSVLNRTASGNAPALRILGGPATGLSNSFGLALGDVTGPFAVVAVPTLSAWAWLVLTAVLAGAAMTYLRSRRATTI
jgi:hypothetical protein